MYLFLFGSLFFMEKYNAVVKNMDLGVSQSVTESWLFTYWIPW